MRSFKQTFQMCVFVMICGAVAALMVSGTPSPSADTQQVLIGLALIAAAIVVSTLVYFAPALIAGRRGHPSVDAIFALNLFLGWTFLGWVGALVWALADH